MVRLIVTGVNGGDGGNDATVLARALGAADDPEVLLTGVWVPLPLLLRPDAKPLEETERMLLRTRAALAPRAITRTLSELSPARALHRTAREEHAGAIVIGSTRKALRGRASVGHDGRQVIHDAPCPVAVAARGLGGGPFAIDRIAVGVDGGPEAAAALIAGRRLAASLGARLKAVAVVDDRPPLRFGRATATAAELLHWEELIARQREQADRIVAGAVNGDAAEGEVRVGDPGVELAQAALDADLLVIGSRHWGRPGCVAVGKVGEALMHGAPCSLLLVPRPAAV